MKPRLVERPAFHVVGMSGRFTPKTMSEIPELWGRFVARMGSIPGRVRPGTTYGVCLADPEGERGPPALEYTAGVEVESLVVPQEMVGLTIPGGTYAVFTHTGPIRKIGETWDAIHERWVRDAGLEQVPGPDFECYDERWDPRTGEGPVDIHVPVRRSAPASGPER